MKDTRFLLFTLFACGLLLVQIFLHYLFHLCCR